MTTPAGDTKAFVARLLKTLLRVEPEDAAVDLWAGRIDAGLDPYAFVARILDMPRAREMAEAPPLAFPPGHFYSPVVDPAQAEAHLARTVVNRRKLPGIEIDDAAMRALWDSFAPFLAEQPFPNDQGDGRYWFANPAYAWGDGTVLHAMLRRFRPKRYVEVGSGYSSACALETAERFLDDDVSLTFIEPYPGLLERLIAEPPALRDVQIIPTPVQDVELSVFRALRENDVLFIDSTHVLKTGSDVAFELLEVLPRLRSGVLVHFHDIPWPFEYGRKWAVEENRSWNEAYALRAFLAHNPDFEIVFFNDYFRRFHREALAQAAPWMLKNTGAAVWLRRR